MGLSLNSFGDFLQYKIAVIQQEMQSFDRPSNHHTEAQRPGQPTPPFTPRAMEKELRHALISPTRDRVVHVACCIYVVPQKKTLLSTGLNGFQLSWQTEVAFSGK